MLILINWYILGECRIWLEFLVLCYGELLRVVVSISWEEVIRLVVGMVVGGCCI